MCERVDVHRFCSDNKEQLAKDTICGCFFCITIFLPKEIERWLNEGSGTALCPYCGIDSVIGESSGHAITKEFLKDMHEYWFYKKSE